MAPRQLQVPLAIAVAVYQALIKFLGLRAGLSVSHGSEVSILATQGKGNGQDEKIKVAKQRCGLKQIFFYLPADVRSNTRSRPARVSDRLAAEYLLPLIKRTPFNDNFGKLSVGRWGAGRTYVDESDAVVAISGRDKDGSTMSVFSATDTRGGGFRSGRSSFAAVAASAGGGGGGGGSDSRVLHQFDLSSLQSQIKTKELEHLYKRYEQRAQIGEYVRASSAVPTLQATCAIPILLRAIHICPSVHCSICRAALPLRQGMIFHLIPSECPK